MLKTVSFVGTCAARSTKVLTSPNISHPYNIKRIRARFPSGCDNKVKLRFIISPDADTPTTGIPNGSSILKDYGQVDYIVGDKDAKDMQHEVAVTEGNTYLKVHAENDDYFEHLIDVQIYIETRERKEVEDAG